MNVLRTAPVVLAVLLTFGCAQTPLDTSKSGAAPALPSSQPTPKPIETSSGGGNGLVASGATLGERDAVPISVVSGTSAPLCQSFAFSQIPHSPDLFLGKLKLSTPAGVCAGSQTLALFRFDWNQHVMTLQHPVMNVPSNIGTGTVVAAYDPYVAEFQNEMWVAFECVGPHIAGASSCVAPLVGTDHIDILRASIPVVGMDNDAKSAWEYSASTPKLLNFNNHLYMYWTAIKIEKAPPHKWDTIETRGAEMDETLGGARQMWVKGHENRALPSHSPGSNVDVMGPTANDSYSNASVDTEGFLVRGGQITILSSVGGTGPAAGEPCTKPKDKVPGCFRLAITQTTNPLAENAFNDRKLIAPVLPANAAEYPRIAMGPDGKPYLFITLHPVQVSPAPSSGKTLATGLVMLPFPEQSLKFQASR